MAKPKKNVQWARLDNAAKIFPPTSDKNDPKVFRFVCELYEDIDAGTLQRALDQTLESFSGYLSVLKHGFFWYYLEATEKRPLVHEEDNEICSPLYDQNEHTLLFDVSYFRKRINFEIYHVLTDGTGALEFMRSLICTYLSIRHRDKLGDDPPTSGYDGSFTEQMADSFQKYYDPKKKKSEKLPRAYSLRGSRLSENRIKVIEGILPVDRLLALSRSCGTTITVLLTAVLMCSIADGMSVRDKKRPVVISVPVNLRNYFSSESTRNFFGIIYVSYHFGKEPEDIESVIKSITEQFEVKLTKENLLKDISSHVSMEHNAALRAVPLVIKDFFMRLGYDLNALSVTAALSNVGKITMPQAYVPYIRHFDVMTSIKTLQICMCSFKNNMVVSFTDSFVSADVQKSFFRYFTKHEIPVEIVTNPLDERRTYG